MRLTREGLLDVDWNKRRSNPTFEAVRRTGRDIAKVLDGKFKDNPPWYAGRVVTVHPLGGCPMGRNEREGVVDSYGQVFGYPGFVDRRRVGHAGPGRPESLEHDLRPGAPLRGAGDRERMRRS